ncbi:Uma2 family endonuclease [Geminocystis sp. CENA526]|uniref:Uma2 family endonuclease n=1 Tax=Geminocystis sp. CENA526 TaxID=1355871 RepID=UPI003D6FE224
MNSLTININSIELNDEQFFQLCQKNRDVKFERNAKGDLIIMPPTEGITGNRNGKITQKLFNWAENNNGIAFDSSTGFKLPNGANRSPDASWIPLEKWQNLTPSQQQKFLPFSPDFVIELLSLTDSLKDTQQKMLEYMENGSKLAWLINPQLKQVEIYRQGKEVEILDNPNTISGEDILPNFTLDLTMIWS